MAYIIIALPFVFLGGFTRDYTFRDGETCFFVDLVNWGPSCYAPGSLVPFLFHYGSMALGLALLITGYLQVRHKRRPKGPA